MTADEFISYQTAVAELAPLDRERAKRKLARIARLSNEGRSRYANLVAATEFEFRVSRRNWEEFFATLLAHDEPIPALRKWAQTRVRQSDQCVARLPLVRAIPRARFAELLISQATLRGMVFTLSDAERLIDDLTDEKRWRIAHRTAARLNLNLAIYTVWATFALRSGVAYGGLPKSANLLACALGFDDGRGRGVEYRGDLPMLVLEYEDHSIEPRFPTMIEAWAGTSPNYYFWPALDGEPHGWTKVWPNAPSRITSRPEVVHEPCSLAALVAPVDSRR